MHYFGWLIYILTYSCLKCRDSKAPFCTLAIGLFVKSRFCNAGKFSNARAGIIRTRLEANLRVRNVGIEVFARTDSSSTHIANPFPERSLQTSKQKYINSIIFAQIFENENFPRLHENN